MKHSPLSADDPGTFLLSGAQVGILVDRSDNGNKGSSQLTLPPLLPSLENLPLSRTGSEAQRMPENRTGSEAQRMPEK